MQTVGLHQGCAPRLYQGLHCFPYTSSALTVRFHMKGIATQCNVAEESLVAFLSESNNALLKFYILVFCMNHGQTVVGRGFSVNKEIIDKNES